LLFIAGFAVDIAVFSGSLIGALILANSTRQKIRHPISADVFQEGIISHWL
jgi:hypothetical protein